MPTRNTEVLKLILQTLEISEPHLLARLEDHFKNTLLIVAGNHTDVAQYAEELRLAIVEQERGAVLDYIQQHGLCKITIDEVEEAINALYPNRFIEP